MITVLTLVAAAALGVCVLSLEVQILNRLDIGQSQRITITPIATQVTADQTGRASDQYFFVRHNVLLLLVPFYCRPINAL